jgi:lipopolysaccharide/colanic/teichoic acid biosynthesis glycosyltransferase
MSLSVAEDSNVPGAIIMAHDTAAAKAQHLPASTSHYYSRSKPASDLVLGVALLIATAPVMLLAMVIIKLTSRGPAVYTQTRLGKNGKPFVIYKLRTMAHQCESSTGARWCVPNDPRITWLGRFLRKTHIDELPQLWNILKGEMSLIGPRPERPEFVPKLELAIPHYRGRLLVKPGVTGLAQVQLPPDTNLASVKVKLSYDLYYVSHANLWFDLRILLCTLCKLGAIPFHVLRRMFALPTLETVESQTRQIPLSAAAAKA